MNQLQDMVAIFEGLRNCYNAAFPPTYLIRHAGL